MKKKHDSLKKLMLVLSFGGQPLTANIYVQHFGKIETALRHTNMVRVVAFEVPAN